jgi:hypothetical protein
VCCVFFLVPTADRGELAQTRMDLDPQRLGSQQLDLPEAREGVAMSQSSDSALE